MYIYRRGFGKFWEGVTVRSYFMYICIHIHAFMYIYGCGFAEVLCDGKWLKPSAFELYMYICIHIHAFMYVCIYVYIYMHSCT